MKNPLTRFTGPTPVKEAPKPTPTPYEPWRTTPTPPIDPQTGNSTDAAVRMDGRRALAQLQAERLAEFEHAREEARKAHPPLFLHLPPSAWGAR